MCAKQKACNSKVSIHKISDACGCTQAPKIASIKMESTEPASCCDSQESSCCSGADPGSEEPEPSGLKPNSSSNTQQTQSWKVGGMDCPACARKVETAVRKIAGVSQVKVLFATEKLVVQLDGSATAALVEDAVINTGFTIDDEKNAIPEHDFSPKSLLKQNIQVISLGLAMGISALAKSSFPVFSHWAFIAICLLGLMPILKKAWQSAQSGSPFSIETLMSVAALGALYLGESAEAAMVLLLFLLGEKLEAFASSKARSGVQSLMKLLPEMATKIVDGQRVEVSAKSLIPGDVIEVGPGERLPADGLVQAAASFDESALTGESVPVERPEGAQVMAGSVVADKVTRIQVTSEQGENAVDRILHLIEDAESHKAPMERFLDKFSRWYTPLMMLVSLLVIVTPPLLFAQPWETWLYRGLALLLIACPCALVISTPAAITSGLAAASRRGVLIKGGAALEQLGNVEAVAFDKTGTLTEGRPQVTDIVPFGGLAEAKLLAYASAIEIGSSHPLAVSIIEKTKAMNIDIPEAQERMILTGMGVQGILDGEQLSILSPSKLPEGIGETILKKAAELESEGKTVAVVTRNHEGIGIIALQDKVRDEAKATISKLTSMGVESIMLTGDNRRSAKSMSSKIGINYQAELLPEDKVEWVSRIAAEKNVAMIGDGINDAPAMKAASIGVAMGGGSDIALETADAALTHNRLNEVAGMIQLSKATISNIKQNVMLALGLKGVFLVTSVLGITGLWVAVLADSGATVLVTINALRLLRLGKQVD
ncbi:zinc/cadmium/mercury/lead-transporting ATPase [Vibrio sp. HN007]|uniref:zinc/cadmium/mercury/lead-transporting ATPase n=1 Tax=Vibrio iocasae TaxID=3098914 RepID=UPI0035D3E24F